MSVFLFIDIVGSTLRWHRYPEAMHGAMASHDALVKRAVHDAGGRVFMHTGDGAGAVFTVVSQAVAAALGVQREVARLSWTAVGGLQVRTGIHVGEVEERDGGLFGPCLSRTVRVMRSGLPGEVVLSGAAAALVAADLPAGTRLRSKGRWQLRGVPEPEHLFGVVDLAGDAGVARSSSPCAA